MENLFPSGHSHAAAASKLPMLGGGKIVRLEMGDSKSGLAYVIERHVQQFNAKRIATTDIPKLITEALANGRIVDYQGNSLSRPIYEVEFHGVIQIVAITVGSNGYIVGANPR